MRFRLRPLTVLIFSVPTALMGVLAACGGGDNTTDGGSDATVDVAKDNAVADVAKDNAVVDAGCDAPSLSVLLEAGTVDAGFNFTPCLSCLMAGSDAGGCGNQVQACNLDCPCRQDIIDFGTCVVQTQDLQNCALTALGSNNANVAALLGCAQQRCLAICAGSAGDGGSDASDAKADAPADATGQ